jgi:hypothetical protein
MSFITSPGLIGFANNQNTAVPNNVIPVSFFTGLSGSAVAVDVAFAPKGTGSILGNIPDNTFAGGNKRGSNAVDLQTVRANAASIAAGSQSVIVGGNNNAVSANLGVVVGGQNNTVSNRGFIGGGFNNLASGNDSGVLIGSNCVASGATSQAGGNSATTRGIAGTVAYSPAAISTVGDIQKCEYSLGVLTNFSAAATILTGDLGAAVAANSIVMPNNSAYKFRVDVIGFASGSGDYKSTVFEGVIQRLAGAGTTNIAGLITTAIANTAGAAAWTITVTANVALGGLSVTVQGDVGQQVKWAATVTTKEVTA